MTEIRALGAESWRAIRDVRLRALADAPGAFTSTLERESGYDEAKWRSLATTGRWFVADDHGELVGVAVGVHGWSGHPTTRELVGMWVAPPHRRSGVARRLVDRVKEWAASEGATTLRLGVREDNAPALAAYRNMGWLLSGETMPEAGQPAKLIILMECDLVPD